LKRAEKEKQVAWLREEFLGAKGLFLASYQGLTVREMTALRAELRSRGIAFKVLKNTLTRLAYQGTDVAPLTRLAYQGTDVAPIAPDLKGTRAAVWTTSEDSVPQMAKLLIDYAKAHPKLELVGGVLGGRYVQRSDMETLAALPPKDDLRARLLGTMMAPVSGFVNTLAAIPRSFLYALRAIEQQKGTVAEAPAEPAA
jgi:large subunit ribosomal protein L10